MSKLETLRSLQARIREATGPDRELDAWIVVMLTPTRATADDLVYLIKTEPEDHCAPGTYWLKQRSGASLRTAPLFTTDPDGLGACVALMREVLPGCEWGRTVDGAFVVWGETYALLPGDEPDVLGSRWPLATDCLTFLDAIISAVIAKEEARETVG